MLRQVTPLASQARHCQQAAFGNSPSADGLWTVAGDAWGFAR
jgi:hypothetical protein